MRRGAPASVDSPLRRVLTDVLLTLLVLTLGVLIGMTVKNFNDYDPPPAHPYSGVQTSEPECRITPAEAAQVAQSWDLAYWTGACQEQALRSSQHEPHLQGIMANVVLRPCATEDSINCYYASPSRGNHQGHPFYSVRVGHKVCIVFMGRYYNRRHGHCGPL